MKTFIFGCDGFVGRNLAPKISGEVVLCDNGFLGACKQEASLEIDITSDKEQIDVMFGAEDGDFIVINLAAIHSIPYCNKNPKDAYYTNTYGNQILYELASKNKCKKYLFASSGAVYQPNINPHYEDDFLESSDIYSASKIAAEQNLELHSLQTDTPVVALRFFNIVGAYDLTPHLLPDVVDQLLGNSAELLLGDLSTIRNYIHVEDVVNAILQLIEVDLNTNFFKVNVCTNKGYSGFELVAAAQKALGTNKNIAVDPSRLRKSDRPSQVGSNALLKGATGWKSEFTFEQGIRDYVDWRILNK